METKIENMSSFSIQDKRIIEVLNCLVSEQKAKFIDGENRTWTSVCKEVESDGHRMNVTTIKKEGNLVARFIYDYDSEEESESYFDFIKMEGDEE